jgi:hypothetical protein
MNQILKQYKRLEAINNHTEAALLLVNHFGSDQEKLQMEQIKSQHEKGGYITTQEIKDRYELSQKYYNRLIKG